MDDDEGLRNYFAAFHLHLDLPPAALVIDDFGDYFTNSKGSSLMNSRARDMAMVRTLALCHNAIAHAKWESLTLFFQWKGFFSFFLQALLMCYICFSKKAACELVLSETSSGDSPRSLFIYKRWIPSIFTIKGFVFFILFPISYKKHLTPEFCKNIHWMCDEGHGDGSFLLTSNGSSQKSAKYSIALQYLILEEIVNWWKS